MVFLFPHFSIRHRKDSRKARGNIYIYIHMGHVSSSEFDWLNRRKLFFSPIVFSQGRGRGGGRKIVKKKNPKADGTLGCFLDERGKSGGESKKGQKGFGCQFFFYANEVRLHNLHMALKKKGARKITNNFSWNGLIITDKLHERPSFT